MCSSFLQNNLLRLSAEFLAKSSGCKLKHVAIDDMWLKKNTIQPENNGKQNNGITGVFLVQPHRDNHPSSTPLLHPALKWASFVNFNFKTSKDFFFTSASGTFVLKSASTTSKQLAKPISGNLHRYA